MNNLNIIIRLDILNEDLGQMGKEMEEDVFIEEEEEIDIEEKEELAFQEKEDQQFVERTWLLLCEILFIKIKI